MAFEEFRKRAAPMPKSPSLTFQKHGTVSLNRPAMDLLGHPKYVVFMYDRDDRIVGLRPTDSENDGYQVRPAPAKGVPEEQAATFVISGRAFLKYYEITPTSSQRFTPYVTDGVLCVDLKGPAEPVSSNREGTGSADADQGALID